ncbi:MAG: hypothetical protein ACJAYU_004428 [Bradymonadia bacterium]
MAVAATHARLPVATAGLPIRSVDLDHTNLARSEESHETCSVGACSFNTDTVDFTGVLQPGE